MKKIYLLRHAESPLDLSMDDKDRILSAHGKVQALNVGSYLTKQKITIDLAICSDATRTKMTLANVVDAGVTIKKTNYQDALYNAPAKHILNAIQQCDANIESVLIVAHNPGIHRLAHMLGERGNIRKAQKLGFAYDPATLSIFDIESDNWANVTSAIITLNDVVIPT